MDIEDLRGSYSTILLSSLRREDLKIYVLYDISNYRELILMIMMMMKKKMMMQMMTIGLVLMMMCSGGGDGDEGCSGEVYDGVSDADADEGDGGCNDGGL